MRPRELYIRTFYAFRFFKSFFLMRDLISKFIGHSLMSWLSFLLNFVIFFMVARKYGITGVGVIALYNLFSMNGLGGLLDLSLSTVIHRELTCESK